MRTNSRQIRIEKGENPYAESLVIIYFGKTCVHITATVEEEVPSFLKGKKQGWVTAEYNMLPRATKERTRRERKSVSGRTQEIQRLIGRSLRSIIDLKKLGERTITLDCDVLVADGGTRTASITGAYVALELAIKYLLEKQALSENPIKHQLGAISVGIDQQGNILADLNYDEDSSCHTDMNIVMTREGHFVEVQGTAEESPFSKEQFQSILSCAEMALKGIFEKQDSFLKGCAK